MNMEGLRSVVVEEDTAVVIQFSYQDRGLDAVVEDVSRAVPADPAEPCPVQVLDRKSVV